MQRKVERAKEQFARDGRFDLPPPGPVGFEHLFYTDHAESCTSCPNHQQAESQANPGEILQFGTSKQLLADDWVLSTVCGIKRHVAVPQKHPGALLVQDKPWESKYFGFYGR